MSHDGPRSAWLLVSVLLYACLARFEVGGPETGSETTTSTGTSDTGEGGDDEECACDAMLEICDDDECVCRYGFTACGGVCVDLLSDSMHCGECDAACTAGVCDAGTCESDGCQGTTDCDGVCVDLQHSPLHCGECNEACAGDELCIEGECVSYQPSDCRSDLDCDVGVCCSFAEQGNACVGGDACP